MDVYIYILYHNPDYCDLTTFVEFDDGRLRLVCDKPVGNRLRPAKARLSSGDGLRLG